MTQPEQPDWSGTGRRRGDPSSPVPAPVLSTTGQVLRATMSDAELAAALTSLRAHRARAVEHLAATDADIAAVEAEIERRARPALKRRARATVVTTGGGA